MYVYELQSIIVRNRGKILVDVSLSKMSWYSSLKGTFFSITRFCRKMRADCFKTAVSVKTVLLQAEARYRPSITSKLPWEPNQGQRFVSMSVKHSQIWRQLSRCQLNVLKYDVKQYSNLTNIKNINSHRTCVNRGEGGGGSKEGPDLYLENLNL